MFDGENGAGGDGTNSNDAGKNDDNANSGGNQEGSFKPITSEAELAQYKADLRRNIAADLRKSIADDLKADQDRKAEDDRKKREADDAKKAGDFEKVETQLRTDLDAAKSEATSLKAENDQLREAMKVGVEAQWKDLPPALQLASKFIPEEDVLGRWTYLNDPDVQKQIKDSDKEVARGSGRDPKSNGATNGVNDDAARRANASRYA
jgi:hypothetical protein